MLYLSEEELKSIYEIMEIDLLVDEALYLRRQIRLKEEELAKCEDQREIVRRLVHINMDIKIHNILDNMIIARKHELEQDEEREIN